MTNDTATHHHYATIAKAITFLRDHGEQQPSLEELSGALHLSKFHLQRTFREWAGVTPKQFLQNLTAERARELLRAGRNTLDTAYSVGLSGNGRLHDLFVKCEAMTPGEFGRGGGGLEIRYRIAPTLFGLTLIAETPRGICKVSFGDDAAQLMAKLCTEFPAARLRPGPGPHCAALLRYFGSWDLPSEPIGVHFRGTPFQLQVWRALLRIPAGELVTYGDVGSLIGKPRAARAVGSAIGKNPVAYLIPCHRVIRGDGALGGYRWSPDRKRIINGFEGIRFGG